MRDDGGIHVDGDEFLLAPALRLREVNLDALCRWQEQKPWLDAGVAERPKMIPDAVVYLPPVMRFRLEVVSGIRRPALHRVVSSRRFASAASIAALTSSNAGRTGSRY